MKKSVRLAIAQINCTVGDIDGNCSKILEYARKADRMGAEIVLFPELAITGYPPEDLLLKGNFIDDNLAAIKNIAKESGDIVIVAGFVDRKKGALYNSAAVCFNGAMRGIYDKMLLPNYGVFDEKRYFAAGTNPAVFIYGDIVFGITICEDIWHDNGPLARQAEADATLILNINSSPYYMGKIAERESMIRRRAGSHSVSIAYANMVGGQDELVFDGQSMIIDSSGKVVARAPAFTEDLLVADMTIPAAKKLFARKACLISGKVSEKERPTLRKGEIKLLEPVAEVYRALSIGLRDYVKKNGFTDAVVGLSGGIDSALVAALAADALGKEKVLGVFMPTRYSSEASEKDATELASRLGIKLISISIEPIFKLYLMTLEKHFAGHVRDITEENLQARIRGNMLMALSNKFGSITLTTGNKSEMSTGYATLYGDMAGGFAVIKDVPKTLVYKLVKYRNSLDRVIPDAIMSKEPTAELAPGQKDRDTLPPYEELDKILKAYVEEDKGSDELVNMGFDRETIGRVLKMVDRSEYKRRQSPPGIKITPKAFGKDRRMPITNSFKSS